MPRRYDSPVRRQRAAETRARIVDAGVELVRRFPTWNWDDLTFRAVAERAGVGERTVYRHFPTQRHLHGAVMRELSSSAGVDYESMGLDDVGAVAARVFASLGSFAARPEPPSSGDVFEEEDLRRREALRRAVAAAAPDRSDDERERVAAVIDTIWSIPSFERLVVQWELDADDAERVVSWLVGLVTDALRSGDVPGS